MSDLFPIFTLNLPAPIVGGVGVGAIDLRSLGEELTPHLRDPFTETVDGQATRPPAAAQTEGPHRYTVIVPNKGENSVFSVGEGDEKTANRNKDTGITGRTKSHVHFHTENGLDTTTLILGGPTKHGWAGPNGVDNPALNHGFMVVTKGKAWHESSGHQYLMSKNSDAVLRTAADARRLVLQADQGEIDILAKKKIYGVAPTITLMAPATFAPDTTFNYDKYWTPTLPETEGGKMSKSVVAWGGIITGAHDLGVKFPKIIKSFKKGLKEWEATTTDSAKWALDLVKWGISFNKMTKLFSSDPDPGQIKLGAEADLGMMAGGDVSVWGGTGFSAGSGVWTSISAGVSASVKAIGWAGLGGMWTSVKGYRKLDLSAEYGKATLKGKTCVDVTAEDGDVKIGGKTTAQLVSDGVAYVVGKDRAVFGGGSGSGAGIVATQDAVKIGMIADITKAGSADTQDEAIMMTRNSHMKLKWANSSIELTSGKIEAKTEDITLWATSGNATVNAKKILLG